MQKFLINCCLKPTDLQLSLWLSVRTLTILQYFVDLSSYQASRSIYCKINLAKFRTGLSEICRDLPVSRQSWGLARSGNASPPPGRGDNYSGPSCLDPSITNWKTIRHWTWWYSHRRYTYHIAFCTKSSY